MQIRLASDITRDSIVDGPGLRAVVWAQGCKHNCPGCHNPSTHDMNGGFQVDTVKVAEKLASLKLQKGVTLSGGDPWFQTEAMTEIAMSARVLGMNVWSYTGFTVDQLLNPNDPHYNERMELLKLVDVLVDGRFEIDKRNTTLLFRGSSNQRLIDVQRTLGLVREGKYTEPVLYDPETYTPVHHDQEELLPLHFAALRHNPQLLDFFLKHGADPAQKDANGRTAFEIADDPVCKCLLFIAQLEGIAAKPRSAQREAVKDAVSSLSGDACQEVMKDQNLDQIRTKCGLFLTGVVQTAVGVKLASDLAQSVTEVVDRSSKNVTRVFVQRPSCIVEI